MIRAENAIHRLQYLPNNNLFSIRFPPTSSSNLLYIIRFGVCIVYIKRVDASPLIGKMKMIIKLGGSLQGKGREIIRFLSDYAEKKDHTVIIIPGGGHFVKRIKELSELEVISDDAAHWMAVLGMHQYGFFLADGSGIEIVESMEELSNVVHIGVLLPYNILKDDDTLPHTWNVTSDTIAAFVAHKVGETSFIKLTDVDGLMDDKGLLVRQIHAKAMIKNAHTGCVDTELPVFLMQNNMSCVIVNGNYTERIIAVIEGKETIRTEIS
jgi:aspartokinase-like uncharacterized kinase